MVFDWTIKIMKNSKKISIVLFWLLIGIIIIQWLVLTIRNVSGVGFFAFFEYAQLVSYMPLLSARYSPHLYEYFKTFLWSNLVLDRKKFYFDPEATYMSDNAKFYGLSNW